MSTKESANLGTRSKTKTGLRFGLRSLIILVAVLACVFATIGASHRRYTRAARIAAAVKSHGGEATSEVTDCLASSWLVKLGYEPLKSIKSVSFFDSDNSLDDQGIELVSSASEIESLILYGDQFTESGLLHLRRLKKLKKINLAGQQVTDSVLTGLPKSDLESLYAYRTSISDKGCASLVDAKKLTHLFLEKSSITDEACRSIGRITSLTYIEIGKNAITDVGVPFLYSLDKLKTIDLVGTHVTKEAKEKFAQKISGLTVH